MKLILAPFSITNTSPHRLNSVALKKKKKKGSKILLSLGVILAILLVVSSEVATREANNKG